MKYHKLHKASFKQSIAFLMLMVIGITLPIACSDLRGPQGLSEGKLINTSFDIANATLSVNGEEITTFPERMMGEVPTLNSGIAFSAKEYGSIILSGTEFEGASKIATVSGNKVDFKINELHFELTKPNGEFIEDEAQLWARHFPNKVAATWVMSSIPYSKLKQADFDDYPIPDTKDASKTQENDFFVVVEEMPVLIGGMKSIQSKMEYPSMARRAGIEGRVTVQFIVNENGDVENAKVVRGIGGGADEEALRVVKEAKFEPGMQRGQPVRVQYAMSINFQLNDSDFTSAASSPPTPVDAEPINVDILKSKNGELQGVVTTASGEPLIGTNIIVMGTNKGTATDTNGEFILKGLDVDNLQLSISHVGYKTKTLTVSL